MPASSRYLLAAGLAGVLLLAAISVRGQDPQAAEPGQVGRYRLAPLANNRVMLVDTATGQCWSKYAGHAWRDEGNPALGPAAAQEAEQRPATLHLPSPTVELTIRQRETKAIPGSQETLHIYLGDITEGQALLSVQGPGREPLVDTASVRAGDTVSFTVDGQPYEIRVRELRNLLTGTDYATLSISAAEPAGADGE